MEVPGVMLIRSVAFCFQISLFVSTDGPFSLCPPFINKCNPSPSGERIKITAPETVSGESDEEDDSGE